MIQTLFVLKMSMQLLNISFQLQYRLSLSNEINNLVELNVYI